MQGQSLPATNNGPTKLDQTLADISSRQDYYSTAYRGGEAFWFALEAQLGHDGVLKVIRDYLAEYQYGMAATEDLIKIIRENAGDKNMDAFLQQWFASEDSR